jgi:phage-related protein
VAKAVVARPKPVMWVGSSKEDLRAFPELVQKEVGFALWFAQIGDKHPHAKPLRGFGGGVFWKSSKMRTGAPTVPSTR